jgi:hypothetical protein
MSTDIERLLYSERQYLRSFDFTAEQSYHLEMRRRLNLALHLWGIVYGLELQKGEVTQGATEQFYVSQGMAIDAYGREIIVSKKHLLSEDLDNNGITAAGTYSVWIKYTREAATPPEAAYRRCDLQDQFTRWRESFEILICSAATNPNPADPDPFGDLPDDPVKFPWFIHLGRINVDSTRTIKEGTNEERCPYIGVRAQRIVAPRKTTKEFKVLGADATHANDPLKPLTSIAVTDNLFLEQNLIVGNDFAVAQQNIVPPPPNTSLPPTFPSSTGNLKVASDFFLRGDLYTHCDSTHPDLWLNLDQCIRERIKNSVPEVRIGFATVQFSPKTSVDASGTISEITDFTITTQLAQVDDGANTIITSIAGIVGKSITQVSPSPTGLLVTGKSTQTFQIETSGTVSLRSDSRGTYNVSLACKVGPAHQIQSGSQAQATQYDVPIDSVTVSYVVILCPKM